MTENPLAFLSLIKTLESSVGSRTVYRTLDPAVLPCHAIRGTVPLTTIQGNCKLIAQHAGLDKSTFTVTVTPHPATTAGHIEFRYDSDYVWVEISTDICSFGEAVLATLCHEVSHKFLHTHGIRVGVIQLEQEYLTDVTAVYLGMGKIMLNGCECYRTDPTSNTTHRLRVGYVSRECLAFVYRVISTMRNIPVDQMLAGLSQGAHDAVVSCGVEYREWFKAEYRDQRGIEALVDKMQALIWDCQKYSAKHEIVLKAARQRIDVSAAAVRKVHRALQAAQQSIEKLSSETHDSHLRYLSALEVRETVRKATYQSTAEFMLHNSELHNVIVVASEYRPVSQSDIEITICPIDGVRLRVPSGRKRLLVTCPSCRYKFMVDTTPLQAEANTARAASVAMKYAHPLKDKLGSLIRRLIRI